MTTTKGDGGSKPGAAHIIAFQGLPGAYSDLACRQVHPDMTTFPCQTFEDAFAVVEEGGARLAMIPIENSVAGRVADIHQLMPHSELYIVAEHFQRVNHHLLAPKGATLDGLTHAHSHVHALSQCRRFLFERGITPVIHADTAGAAKDVATRGDPTEAAIASELAAETYGLVSLAANIEDATHNTTRFVVLAKEIEDPGADAPSVMTAFHFGVRNVSAALYKALGCFATNGVNMTKLESYMVGGNFSSTEFYAEIEGHPEDGPAKLALDELDFYTEKLRIIGIFPAHPFRKQTGEANGG
ncbi:MAG: prephenate dehydratase [Alphaproteobacteria bacterium]|nr:prephenate dehydratase [Alphaproteobacteria bacterium]